MKFRHAAAFVIGLTMGCGIVHEQRQWYFIRPPLKSSGYPDAFAPKSAWTLIATFDSRTDCEKAPINLGIEPKPTAKPVKPDDLSVKEMEIAQQRLILSDCIAADDPRLNSN